MTAPGGVIIVILTCHRELHPGEMSLRLWEKILVKLVCNACYFSLLCPSSDYAGLMKSASLEVKLAQLMEHSILPIDDDT